jgi:hypothetical protein
MTWKELYKECLLLQELASPEATEDDPFGKYFGGAKRKEAGFEPNTDSESKLLFALNNYVVDGEGGEFIIRFANQIKTLLSQNKYVDYLRPQTTEAWRVLVNVSVENASTLCNVDKQKIIQPKPYGITPGNSGTYPSNGLSSWAEDIDDRLISSLRSMQGNLQPGFCVIVFEANVKNNSFILNWKKLSQAPFMHPAAQQYLKDEREVLGIGPIKYNASYIVYNGTKEVVDLEEAIDPVIN